jgi:hypothetical protein
MTIKTAEEYRKMNKAIHERSFKKIPRLVKKSNEHEGVRVNAKIEVKRYNNICRIDRVSPSGITILRNHLSPASVVDFLNAHLKSLDYFVELEKLRLARDAED